MKFTSATVILSLFSAAYAVTIADLPACSVSCFATAIASTSCSLTDVNCQCTTGKAAITASVTPCLVKACSADDVTKTATVSAEICASASSSSSSGSSTATKSGSTSTKSTSATGTSSAAAQTTSNAASAMKAFEVMGAGVCVVAAGMLAL